MNNDMTLLKVNSIDPKFATADIIFVHGLDGNTTNTWKANDQSQSFPEMLASNHKTMGVCMIDEWNNKKRKLSTAMYFQLLKRASMLFA